MSGDYSRFTHRPERRYSGVLMQQGRVQLDADWNEGVDIARRRWEVQAEDTFGASGVPRATTPDGFKISSPAGGDFGIGAGRIYVDGKLAELFANEETGNPPLPISYLHQPFYPAPPPLTGPLAGAKTVFLDVWDREVTYVEDPDILEKALGGPDTATRLQTVWQVRVVAAAGGRGSQRCGAPLPAPSGGRLSTHAVAPPPSDDPCDLAPGGGYRGLENRLYRVEVHRGGSLAATRFKWSRDNASVVAAVTGIAGGASASQLAVTRIGRDAVLRFAKDDWVEVTDDFREVMGEPGEMAKIANVDEATRTITLDRVVPAAGNRAFGATAQEVTGRHTRLRLWNQSLGVDTEGLLAQAGGPIALEDGVEVELSQSGTADLKTGDYWVFAARAVDGSVETLVNAGPRGIRHHYTQLASITVEGQVHDCRHLWPESPCCCCTVEVGDGEASHGDFDDLVDAVRALSDPVSVGERRRSPVPVTICLLPGTHRLRETVVIDRSFVTIRGCGRVAPVIGPRQGTAFDVRGDLVRIEGIYLAAKAPFHPAILCSGNATLLADNEIETSGAPAVLSWGSEGLHVLGNQMRHVPKLAITDDDASAERAADSEIGWRSADLPGGVPRDAVESGLIVLESGTAAARVIGNEIGPGRWHGIAVAVAPQRELTIAANEIRGLTRSGIASVESQVVPEWAEERFIAAVISSDVDRRLPSPGRVDGLRIEHNTIADCVGPKSRRHDGPPAFGGIVLARVDHLLIAGNRIEDNGTSPDGEVPVAGVYVRNVRGWIVRDNVIVGNGQQPDGSKRIPGPQGGILGEELSVILESIPVDAHGGGAAVQPDGWPAAAVHGNLVVAPRGPALFLMGAGPMPVTDNRLVARDVLGPSGHPAPYDLCGAVAIVNLGVPAFLTRQLLATGFRTTKEPELPTRPAPPDEVVVGGKVEFSNNQVVLDLARLEVEIAIAAVGILTLDDLGFHDNQTECTLAFDFLVVDALLVGTTVRATGNSLTESWSLTYLSLLALGFLMCTATSNQSTHCIKVACLKAGMLVEDHNLALRCDRGWRDGWRLFDA